MKSVGAGDGIRPCEDCLLAPLPSDGSSPRLAAVGVFVCIALSVGGFSPWKLIGWSVVPLVGASVVPASYSSTCCRPVGISVTDPSERIGGKVEIGAGAGNASSSYNIALALHQESG